MNQYILAQKRGTDNRIFVHMRLFIPTWVRLQLGRLAGMDGERLFARAQANIQRAAVGHKMAVYGEIERLERGDVVEHLDIRGVPHLVVISQPVKLALDHVPVASLIEFVGVSPAGEQAQIVALAQKRLDERLEVGASSAMPKGSLPAGGNSAGPEVAWERA